MKTIQLTQGKIAFIDDADFEKVSQHKWFAEQDSKSGRWYARRNISLSNGKQKRHGMHRFIMGLEYGDPREVDHKALGIESGLDNRRSNLRVTLDRNQQNTARRKDNGSGFKGVSWHKRDEEWRAYICVSGKRKHLGAFSTAELAARAYDAAALEYHGEFAVTNASLGLLKKSVQSVVMQEVEHAA